MGAGVFKDEFSRFRIIFGTEMSGPSQQFFGAACVDRYRKSTHAHRAWSPEKTSPKSCHAAASAVSRPRSEYLKAAVPYL